MFCILEDKVFVCLIRDVINSRLSTKFIDPMQLFRLENSSSGIVRGDGDYGPLVLEVVASMIF